MKLGDTRRLLSYFAMIFASVASLILIFSTVFNYTLANGNYVKERLVTDELTQQCIAQLEIKFSELEAESNIPIRVFETMADEFTVSQSLKENVEGCYNDDAELTQNRQTLVNSFEGLCKEYLDGNKIKYNSESVKHAAEKAADIYYETTSIKGLDGAAEKAVKLKGYLSGAALVSIIALALSLLALLMLYSNRKRVFFNFFAAVSTGAFAGVVTSVAGLISKPALKLGVTPALYGDILSSLMSKALIMALLASLALFIISYLTVYLIFKKLMKAEE